MRNQYAVLHDLTPEAESMAGLLRARKKKATSPLESENNSKKQHIDTEHDAVNTNSDIDVTDTEELPPLSQASPFASNIILNSETSSSALTTVILQPSPTITLQSTPLNNQTNDLQTSDNLRAELNFGESRATSSE